MKRNEGKILKSEKEGRKNITAMVWAKEATQ